VKDASERRFIIFVMLCMVVVYGWSAMFGPRPAPVVETTPAAEPVAAPVVPAPAAAVAAPAAPCVRQDVPVNSSGAEVGWSTCGGAAKVVLPGYRGRIVTTPWWSWVIGLVTGSTRGGWVAYREVDGVETLVDGGAFAVPGAGEGELGSWDVLSTSPLALRHVRADGLTVTQTVTPGSAPDVFDVDVRFEATQAVAGPFWVGIRGEYERPQSQTDSVPQLEASVDGRLYQLSQGGSATGCTGMFRSIAEEELHGAVGWVGVADRYFMAALLPADPSSVGLRFTDADEGTASAARLVATQASVGPGQPLAMKLTMFAGVKQVERLDALGHDLGVALDFGLFGLFSKTFLFILNLFHGFLGNWGAAIILLTCAVRGAFYPITRKAFLSGKAMSALQPEIKKLQEQFAEDKERLNRETMALFSKHGVNPLAGCFPMLIQIPVFFALYAGLQLTPDLFHAPFLYIKDLSAPDPLGILPAGIAAGMILQQRMTPMTGMDPQQQQMMKMMPWIFSLMMFSLPAGLSLYYTFNSGLAILQQWYNVRSFERSKAQTVQET
jgi:YidC/Oxa1 family membrane protein insertase